LPEDEPESTTDAAGGGGGEPADVIAGDRRGPEERGRRHGRRDSSPRHGAPDRGAARYDEDGDEEPQEVIETGGGAGEPDLDSGAEIGDDDGGEEQTVSYEDVPTWEEAISYLLHPNQVQVESGAEGGSTPSRGAPPADQPRQTRHIGHRKHRR
jgi:hypothetical protein